MQAGWAGKDTYKAEKNKPGYASVKLDRLETVTGMVPLRLFKPRSLLSHTWERQRTGVTCKLAGSEGARTAARG